MMEKVRGSILHRSVVLAGAYVVVAFAFEPLHVSVFGVPLTVRPEVALPIPLGILFGPAAAWGLAGGVFLSELLSRSLGIGSFFLGLATFYSAFAASRLWSAFRRPVDLRFGRLPTVSVLVQFGSTALVSVAGAAAIVAWGAETAAISPFYVSAVFETATRLLATFGLGGPLLVFGWYVLRAVGVSLGDRPSGARLRPVTASTAVWLCLGVVGSLGYRSVERIPEAFLTGPRQYVTFVTQPLFGPGAARLQIIFGAVLFGVLVLSFARPEFDAGGES